MQRTADMLDGSPQPPSTETSSANKDGDSRPASLLEPPPLASDTIAATAAGVSHLSPKDLRKVAAAARAFGSPLRKDSPSLPDGGGGAAGALDPASRHGSSASAASSSSTSDPSTKLKAAGKAVMALAPSEQRRRELEALGLRHTADGPTPAQAMTRLTGTIFDHDADVPAVLRRVATVAPSDTIQKAVEATRPAFERLVYWDALVGSLNVSAAVFAAYILGRLGSSLPVVLLLVILLSGSVRRSFLRLKSKIQVDATRLLALRRVEAETEPVEWLNRFLGRLWAQMEPSLSASLKASLDSTLSASKPSFLEDLSLSVFTLGSAAPRIDSIRTIGRTPDDVHLMDWDLNFTPVDEDMVSKRERELGDVRQSRIEIVAKLGKGLAVIPLPIVVAEIEFRAKLRLGIKYMSQYPHVKNIEYSFLETPKVDFVLRPLKALDMMDTPGLQSFLNDTIASSLSGFVEPHKNHVDIEAMFTGAESDYVVGVLRVTVYEARDLKNVELAGKSDPFTVIKLGGKEVARTSHNDATYSQVDVGDTSTSPRPDELRLEVYDFNETLKHKFMGGTTALTLSQWIKLLGSSGSMDDEALVAEWGTPFDEKSDVWRPLTIKEEALGGQASGADLAAAAASGGAAGKPSKLRGELRIDMAYFPAPIAAKLPTEASATDEPLDVSAASSPSGGAPATAGIQDPATAAAQKEAEEAARKAQLAKLTTGVLTATVHQAKELACGKTAGPQCFVELLGVETPPTGPTAAVGCTDPIKKTNNPAWDKPIAFYVSDSAAAKCRFYLKDTRDGSSLGETTVIVKDVINQPPEAAVVDWFKLTGVISGKLRVTFKWCPIDFQAAQSANAAKVVRKEPIGLARIKVVEAKGVANVEAFRKSDPYCRLALARRVFGKTLVRDNTLDPVWNETFFAPFYARSEPLRLELWDFNSVKKDRTLGRVEFALTDLVAEAAGTGVTSEATDPALARSRADGLKVTDLGNGVLDILAPIYIPKSDEDNSDPAGAKDPARATSPPLSSTAAAGAGPRQRGYLRFELELSPVAADYYVRPETEAEAEASARRLEEAEAELRRVQLLAEVGVLKPADDGAEHEKLVASREELAKAAFLQPAKVLAEMPSGIARIRVHRATGLSRPLNVYAEVLLDNEAAFQTRPQRRTASPAWDALADIYVRDAAGQSLTLQLRSVAKDDAAKQGSDDPVVAVWVGSLADVVGRKNVVVDMKSAAGEPAAKLVVSVGYAPIAALTDSGVLFLDIVEAIQLEAVDSGGTSDPYCVVNMGGIQVHKTKILKKNLNPVFDETCAVAVRSRQRETLTVLVRDYNAMSKHTTLGSVSVQLSQVRPDELLDTSLPLDGARGGRLHFRLLIDTRPDAWEACGRDPGEAESVLSATTSVAADQRKGLGGLLGRGARGGSAATAAAASAITSRKSALDRASDLGLPAMQLQPPSRPGTSLRQAASIDLIARAGSAAATYASGDADTASVAGSDVTSQSTRGYYGSTPAPDEPPPPQTANGTFNITVVEARGLRAVDAGGTSDPFVVVSQLLHGKSKTLLKTRVAKKTLTPKWSGESIAVKVPPARIAFTLKDHNVLAESKPLGEVAGDLFDLLLPLPQQQQETQSELALQDFYAAPRTFDVWLPVGVGGTGELHLTGDWRPDSSTARGGVTSVPALSRATSALALLRPASSASSLGVAASTAPSVSPELPPQQPSVPPSSVPPVPPAGEKEKRKLFAFGKH
ncbi:hypothetical protein HK405_004734 [Cladochytrium tenue]|nr:hypothetical protein HK405_004734 [Cladochytrium tenue]